MKCFDFGNRRTAEDEKTTGKVDTHPDFSGDVAGHEGGEFDHSSHMHDEYGSSHDHEHLLCKADLQ